MNAIRHIRKSIFQVTQTEFAVIARVTQPTVSRWESGEHDLSRAEMDAIRNEAVKRGLDWSDSLFFSDTERAA